MQAAVIKTFGGIESISIEEVPLPTPQEHEVQIAVRYAGVNPIDWKMTEGHLKDKMESRFPITLGWDAAGTISAIGKKVSQFKMGDAVYAYCRKEIVHEGTFASHVCVKSDAVAHKPKSLSFDEAAAVPLAALTAWQALYDVVQLKAKEKILIHAGAGGVGGFALSFAHLTGAHVITTASATHHDYVKSLGADEVIDYTQENFAEVVLRRYPEGIDALFDTVGGETLKNSYSLLKEKGRLVTIADAVDSALAAQRSIVASFHFVHPDGQQLAAIAQLFDKGKIKPPLIQKVPLEEVKSALRNSRTGHTQGKIVLQITN